MSTNSPEPAARPVPLLFQWLRWQLLRNATGSVLRRSALRLLTILGCSLLVWGFVFGVSMAGFHELAQQVPLGGEIVGTLFDLLFFAMLVMLTFSSAIILYSSLFGSAEAAFLLSTPAPADQVFAYKCQGAIGFSSWAFVLLGSPILIAYGLAYTYRPLGLPVETGVDWYFYALLPLFFLGFVLVPGSIGALACLLVVNLLPRKRKHVVRLAALLVVGAVALVLIRTSTMAKNNTLDRQLVERMVGQIAFAQGPLVPSHWMSRGVRAAARRDLAGAFYNLGLLWSTGLVLYGFSAWAAGRLYRRGYNRLATGGDARRRHGGAWMDAVFGATLGFFDRQTQLLIVKDFRTFRRDPAQWAQVVLFSGLIALYITNVRRFIVTDQWAFQNGLSLLNLCAVALLLCTYTGRFIYPMLSLEGRCFWVLGLLPLARGRLLWGKFAFSAAGSLLIAEILVLLSDVMLMMPWLAIVVHALTVAVLALGLSGLSVGLGACLPNFRETDPSKIAVGFGGTLNLVAGLFYLNLVIALMAGPWHLQAGYGPEYEALGIPQAAWGIAGGVLLGLGLGAAAVVVPLKVGARALRRMEF